MPSILTNLVQPVEFNTLGYSLVEETKPTENWVDGEHTADVSIVTTWANRLIALRSILGGVDGDTPNETVNAPCYYSTKFSNGFHRMYAVTASCEPRFTSLTQSETTPITRYVPKECTIDIHFTWPKWRLDTVNQRFVAEQITGGGAEFVSLPPTDLYWKNADASYTALTNEEAPGKKFVFPVYLVTLYHVPTSNANIEGLKALSGTVNKEPVRSFQFSNITFAPHELLMGEPIAELTTSIYGKPEYTIHLPMTWRANIQANPPAKGWNGFFRGAFTTLKTQYDYLGSPVNRYEEASWLQWLPAT